MLLQVQVRYLPGNVTHGDAVLLHAALPSVVRRVSYLVGGGRCTVYSPLQGERTFLSLLTQRGRFQTHGTYLIGDILIRDQFSENGFRDGGPTDVTLKKEGSRGCTSGLRQRRDPVLAQGSPGHFTHGRGGSTGTACVRMPPPCPSCGGL